MYDLDNLFSRLSNNECRIIEKNKEKDNLLFFYQIERQKLTYLKSSKNSNNRDVAIRKIENNDEERRRLTEINTSISKINNDIYIIKGEIDSICHNKKTIKGNDLYEFNHNLSLHWLRVEQIKQSKTTHILKIDSDRLENNLADKEKKSSWRDGQIARFIDYKCEENDSNCLKLYREWITKTTSLIRERLNENNNNLKKSIDMEYKIDLKIKDEIRKFNDEIQNKVDLKIKDEILAEEKNKKIEHEKQQKREKEIKQKERDRKQYELEQQRIKADSEAKERLKQREIDALKEIELQKIQLERERMEFEQEKEKMELEREKMAMEIRKMELEKEMADRRKEQEELRMLREQAQYKGIHDNIESLKDYQKKS